MKLDDLLRDVTRASPNESRRQQHIALTEMLNGRYGPNAISLKGVEKWFARGSIPSAWLIRIAALLPAKSNITDYAN